MTTSPGYKEKQQTVRFTQFPYKILAVQLSIPVTILAIIFAQVSWTDDFKLFSKFENIFDT